MPIFTKAHQRTIAIIVAIALATLIMIVGWFFLQANPIGGPGRAVVIEVKTGESASQLASELEKQGVIGSAFAFRLESAVLGTPLIRTGYFEVRKNSSFSDVHSIFSNAANAHVVKVVPGLTLHEVALRVEGQMGSSYANSFVIASQKLAKSSPYAPNGSLEGLIGAGEYVVGPSESPRELVSHMNAVFVRQAQQAGIVPGRSVNGLTPYQLIVAASIVEKEGYYQKNMGKVARVILNRIASGGGLQMDATILYALGIDGGRVTSAMLRIDSPYNSYLHAGLTPTPICTPSSFALHSITNPPSGNWRYFTLISRDGTMAFSETFAEQLANERIAASRGI